MRTNIEIDDDLMRRALIASGSATKRDAVEKGLKLLIQMEAQQAIRSLRGVGWEGDLEQMRLD